MSRRVNSEIEEFFRLSKIADERIAQRKIRNMRKPFGVKWENLYGLSEIEEFEYETDAAEFARIVDGLPIISGRVIA